MATQRLDGASLGDKRRLMLRAINACWVAHGRGPTWDQLQALGRWPWAKHHYLMTALTEAGWITGEDGQRHSTRLTPEAYHALGWDAPDALCRGAS